MKDRIFSGVDIDDAVAVAAANLGLPKAELRYVVLEAGNAGGRGLKPTPARIAVMLEDGTGAGRRAGGRPPAATAPAADPRAGLVGTIRAVAEAGGLEVQAEIEEAEEALLVRLEGKDREFFLEPDGKAEVLQATEHLLLRLYGAAAPAARRAAHRRGLPRAARRSARRRGPARRRRGASLGPGRRRCRGSTPTSGASCTWRCRRSPGSGPRAPARERSGG